MMTTKDVETYIASRLSKYREAMETSLTFEDTEQIAINEAVMDELNHLITIINLSPVRT